MNTSPNADARTHTHCFSANYSSVVIEVDVFSRCRLRKFGEVGGDVWCNGEGGGAAELCMLALLQCWNIPGENNKP